MNGSMLTLAYFGSIQTHSIRNANQKRERQDMDDEQREQRMIQEQIERTRLESSGSGSKFLG
ncbi:hypothetical protein BC936DRAFT_144837 [Jimgerdemannia flammicorona]|uniref:Uncharacterized protein n=1 Tax=Jimgerdemannia flammicorona TaxID=994334 RepID=A0A433DBK1_9FUNG|nr:hypothetical protein BC936DRAFT_144837 [Jimgerdemannia flammicorona]